MRQVHSKRPPQKMETESRAMLLVGFIIETYLNADGGEDWRFCLATSQLLVEIVKNNVTKGNTAEIQSWDAYHLSELAGLISQFASGLLCVAKLILLWKDKKFGQKQLSVGQD